MRSPVMVSGPTSSRTTRPSIPTSALVKVPGGRPSPRPSPSRAPAPGPDPDHRRRARGSSTVSAAVRSPVAIQDPSPSLAGCRRSGSPPCLEGPRQEVEALMPASGGRRHVVVRLAEEVDEEGAGGEEDVRTVIGLRSQRRDQAHAQHVVVEADRRIEVAGDQRNVVGAPATGGLRQMRCASMLSSWIGLPDSAPDGGAPGSGRTAGADDASTRRCQTPPIHPEDLPHIPWWREWAFSRPTRACAGRVRP